MGAGAASRGEQRFGSPASPHRGPALGFEHQPRPRGGAGTNTDHQLGGTGRAAADPTISSQATAARFLPTRVISRWRASACGPARQGALDPRRAFTAAKEG